MRTFMFLKWPMCRCFNYNTKYSLNHLCIIKYNNSALRKPILSFLLESQYSMADLHSKDLDVPSPPVQLSSFSCSFRETLTI